MVRQDIIDMVVNNQGCCVGPGTSDSIFEVFNIANSITAEYYKFISGVQLFVRAAAEVPGGNYAGIIKVFNINNDDFTAVHHIAGTTKVNNPVLTNSIVVCGERILETLLFPKYDRNEYRYGTQTSFADQMVGKSIKEQYRQLFLVNMVAEDLKEVTVYSDQLFSAMIMLCKRIAKSYINIVYIVDKTITPDFQETIFSHCLPLHFRIFKQCKVWCKSFH